MIPVLLCWTHTGKCMPHHYTAWWTLVHTPRFKHNSRICPTPQSPTHVSSSTLASLPAQVKRGPDITGSFVLFLKFVKTELYSIYFCGYVWLLFLRIECDCVCMKDSSVWLCEATALSEKVLFNVLLFGFCDVHC